MKNFIKVTPTNQADRTPIWINLDTVASVEKCTEGTRITLTPDDGHVYTVYESVEEILKQMQSGLRDTLALMFCDLVNAENESVSSVAESLGIRPEEYNWRTHWPIILARRSYEMADAFIAERNK